MKRLEGPDFDPYRVPVPSAIRPKDMPLLGNDKNGAFMFESDGVQLRVIASSGGGWDHVSVHAFSKGTPHIPTYNEMCWVKRRFFKASETAMQLHVAERDHISNHDYTLHLWRPHKGVIPLPPKEMV